MDARLSKNSNVVTAIQRETGAARSSLKSGLDVLQLLSQRQDLTLTEISIALGKSKSGMHSILNTLRERSFIERISSGEYRLGPRAWELGRASYSFEIDELARPFLARLEERTSEGVIHGVLDGFDVLYLSILPGKQAVRLNVEVAERIPANMTSTGICLLAALPDEEISRLLPEMFEKSTEFSVSNPKALWREIEAARVKGYSIMKRGWHVDVGGMAKCVMDEHGKAVSAICVSAPLYRVDQNWYDTVLKEIEFAVRCIEDRMNDGRRDRASGGFGHRR
ncbi:IclR family transcriptional regulator [Pikeienuella piscinae]|uniref:IclR family transcriptional regulator n=1 Tax=Pikeienuella piscinae TaxID=2748098 RepID=A0A7L5BT79_9RHOB|nr:IclR family transcriptional regulator [Pikeienuella piscinae]QIE54161.1 IclR family transcriptional regulator [Pikeienuella piscinae]